LLVQLCLFCRDKHIEVIKGALQARPITSSGIGPMLSYVDPKDETTKHQQVFVSSVYLTERSQFYMMMILTDRDATLLLQDGDEIGWSYGYKKCIKGWEKSLYKACHEAPVLRFGSRVARFTI
jgi:hypothetical protein